MAVPYTFATIPNGQTIPLQYLDANFSYIETQLGSITTGVTSISGGSTGLTPSVPTTGNVILSGTLNIANGGTGSSTASGAINALIPSQTGNSGKFLTTDGSAVAWSTSGLSVSNGGTGATTAQGATTNLLPSQAGSSGYVLSTNGAGVLSWIPAGGAATMTIGVSPIAGGTSGYILYNNGGFLGNLTASGSGSVVRDTSATITTPTVNQPNLVALREQQNSLTITAGAITIDCDAASVFYILLNSNITTITFSNVPAAGKSFSIVLSIEADGTPRTITWPASVKWPSGVAPVMTSTAGQTDTFTMFTYDGGTKWFAFVSGQDS